MARTSHMFFKVSERSLSDRATRIIRERQSEGFTLDSVDYHTISNGFMAEISMSKEIING